MRAVRIAALWLALLCLPPIGAAMMQPAVVKPDGPQYLAAMLEKPSLASRPVIALTSGTPVEVLMDAGAGWLMVQAGEPGAGITGYMTRDTLRMGDTAPRVVQPAYYRAEFAKEMPVYAYPDDRAPVIGACVPGKAYYWQGVTDDGFAMLCLPPQDHLREAEDRLTRGFVRFRETDGQHAAAWAQVILSAWTVEPRAGEATREEVIALAKEYVLQNSPNLPEAYRGKEMLDALSCRANRIQWVDSLVGYWWVYFYEEAGGDVVRVHVDADGGMGREANLSLDILTPEMIERMGLTDVL